MGQIRVSRTQDGATVGADWSSNVSNILGDTVYNNDDSVALGFNPTFSDWPTGDARPTGWDHGNTGPTERTTIKRVGEFSTNSRQTARGLWHVAHRYVGCGAASRQEKEHLCRHGRYLPATPSG